ncbi:MULTISPECIES: hypothetical protein [unclassified Bradyrhizobium]|uniref:hypothetical protein n=1 Tax=unclassified Bradyrhizobium TaxID=2631580 RepID=UPI0004260AE1|nr:MULTISPECIES: hypothetical protein [unclassified Bradyrhizobium]MCP3467855.1 hypothetical protein [Bradyrhizobium sp. CCGUVB23]
MPELPAPADVLDPPDAGNGPVVLTLAMLLAATLTRKLAAESPDVAIEGMLMNPDLQDKSYAFIHAIGKIRRFLFSSS